MIETFILIIIMILVFMAWRSGLFKSDTKIEKELEDIEREDEKPQRPKYTTRLDGSQHD